MILINKIRDLLNYLDREPEYIFIEKYAEVEEVAELSPQEEPNKLRQIINSGVAKFRDPNNQKATLLMSIGEMYSVMKKEIQKPDYVAKQVQVWRVVVQEDTQPNKRVSQVIRTKDNWEPDSHPGDKISVVSENGHLLAIKSITD